MATLARGGRLNVFGFVLRLAARCRSCSSRGRIYGADALGRFAYAVLTVEFAAQIAALGLRRGLAQLLANAKKPQSCIVADALLVAALGSAIGMAILFVFPQGDVSRHAGRRARLVACDHGLRDQPGPTSRSRHWPITTMSASTVRARSVVEPWTISIAALAWSVHVAA